jgi:nitroreductase
MVSLIVDMKTQEISLFEAIHSQRAIRRFTDEPVPDEAIQRILEAAVRAPSGRNRQPWRFVVIRDEVVKQQIGDFYRRACEAAGIGQKWIPELSKKVNESVAHLANHMGDAPVLILPCIEHATAQPAQTSELTAGSSIYPAVQNLMLAARALGLGTTLTTVHTMFEDEIKTLLGIPRNVQTTALIPMGYPAPEENFGGSRRRPVTELTHYDHWKGNDAG